MSLSAKKNFFFNDYNHIIKPNYSLKNVSANQNTKIISFAHRVVHLMHKMKTNTPGNYIYWYVNINSLKYLDIIRNMFVYEFSSIIFEK